MKIKWLVVTLVLLIILLIVVIFQQYLSKGFFSSKSAPSLIPALDNISEELNSDLEPAETLKSLLK
jgi:hypothetical protein